MTQNIGNGSIPLRIGNLIETRIYGGPFKDCPYGWFGVKLAPEIRKSCDVLVPIADYSVPEISDLQAGIVKTLMATMVGHTVYVGCFGGWGRTGLFLSALTKVQVEYRKAKHRAGRDVDPVGYVRSHYSDRAVETHEQEEFLDNLDVSEVVNWLTITQRALHGTGDFVIGRDAGKCIKEMLDRSVLKGVITYPERIGGEGDTELRKVLFSSKRDSIAEVYKSQETDEFKNYFTGNDGVDHEIADPAHDRHWANWKEGRARHVNEISDWVENGGDSAGNLVDPVTVSPEELQWQIDDLLKKHSETEYEIKFLADTVTSRFLATSKVLKTLKAMIDTLTKPSWYERIREYFE